MERLNDINKELKNKKDMERNRRKEKQKKKKEEITGEDEIRGGRKERWKGKSKPDCLSVSSGYTTDQFVLGVPLGSPKTSNVPPGSHVARVRERVSSWVSLFRTLIGSEGKGRGKLTSDREGSVTCHMST
ncbi:hypothetical protein E6C27_scaffold96G002220 [Cucumis melo var. makuwa]|uniref:Uncharacterized protein n=1 Tax=Cucumis melo var. makuwa TaxID=1194695 RepID=A0A5A7US93_CUCMM|nr:hypothetical protein E6C27_scaffold96G002220 [Cucumis melo var. makuwa]